MVCFGVSIGSALEKPDRAQALVSIWLLNFFYYYYFEGCGLDRRSDSSQS